MTTPFKPYEAESLNYYYRGFVRAYLARNASAESEEVSAEFADPYNDGIADGERYAIEGFPIEPACYDLSMENNNVAGTAGEIADLGIEAYGVGRSLWHLAFGAAFFEGAVLLLMASIAATTHYQYPEEALKPHNYEEFAAFLGGLSDPLSVELYVGGGVDLDSEGCQLGMTRLYKSVEQVRDELARMNRAKFIVCAVRTDMSGGLRIVDQSPE